MSVSIKHLKLQLPFKMRFKTIVIMTCIMGSVHMQKPKPKPNAKDQARLDGHFTAAINAAKQITLINAPLLIVGLGPFPIIINNIASIISELNTNTNNNTIRGYDLKKLCELMNPLIQKSNILEKVPLVGQPIAAALRQLQASAETNAIKNELPLTAVQQKCMDDAISKYNSLLNV